MKTKVNVKASWRQERKTEKWLKDSPKALELDKANSEEFLEIKCLSKCLQKHPVGI